MTIDARSIGWATTRAAYVQVPRINTANMMEARQDWTKAAEKHHMCRREQRDRHGSDAAEMEQIGEQARDRDELGDRREQRGPRWFHSLAWL